MEHETFIDSIKKTQPQLWNIIVSAAEDGLIHIDEENDGVTATNRLLLTYPGLHDILAYLTDQWAENTFDQKSFSKNFFTIKKTYKKTSDIYNQAW